MTHPSKSFLANNRQREVELSTMYGNLALKSDQSPESIMYRGQLWDDAIFQDHLRRDMACKQPLYKVIVAIDFGTTFTGFAFSFLNTTEGEPGIHLNKEWGNAQGLKTAKAPTSVLLTPDKAFCKFGYEAAERYAKLEDADNKDFHYFERFKMLLHNRKVWLLFYFSQYLGEFHQASIQFSQINSHSPFILVFNYTLNYILA